MPINTINTIDNEELVVSLGNDGENELENNLQVIGEMVESLHNAFISTLLNYIKDNPESNILSLKFDTNGNKADFHVDLQNNMISLAFEIGGHKIMPITMFGNHDILFCTQKIIIYSIFLFIEQKYNDGDGTILALKVTPENNLMYRFFKKEEIDLCLNGDERYPYFANFQEAERDFF